LVYLHWALPQSATVVIVH